MVIFFRINPKGHSSTPNEPIFIVMVMGDVVEKERECEHAGRGGLGLATKTGRMISTGCAKLKNSFTFISRGKPGVPASSFSRLRT